MKYYRNAKLLFQIECPITNQFFQVGGWGMTVSILIRIKQSMNTGLIIICVAPKQNGIQLRLMETIRSGTLWTIISYPDLPYQDL